MAQTSSSLWCRFLSCCSRSEGGPCSSSLSCLSRRLSSTRGSSALCRGRIPLWGQTDGLQWGHPHLATQLGTVPSPRPGSHPCSPAVAEEQLPVQLPVALGLPHWVWHLPGLDEAPVAIGGHVRGENITPVTLWRGSRGHRGMRSPWDGSLGNGSPGGLRSPMGEGHQGRGHWGVGSPRGMGQPGTGSPGDGVTLPGSFTWSHMPAQGKILDTSPHVPQPGGLGVSQSGVPTCCPPATGTLQDPVPKCPCPYPQASLWFPYSPIIP